MASIGVIEKRESLTVTVKLHGPDITRINHNAVQLKNFVKALINKHMDLTSLNLCNAIANEVIDVYKDEFTLWSECSIETTSGYTYNAAAERVGVMSNG